ncbi:uncharacterized protein [Haliotis cracherodii]|uniref:uncharacterized protein n=1 Tax=Haliotis cracherodii TaxID=6455 RepID=UPI0039EB6D67
MNTARTGVFLLLVAVAMARQEAYLVGVCKNMWQRCEMGNSNGCCAGLSCRGSNGVTRCERNWGNGGCRSRNEECKITGENSMKCCETLRCQPGPMNKKMVCQ